ncbi:unnamed protein product [Mesocestoides corti]|uniref:Uncharacterized protein n=2 Tax=Mesocestoides corti TaxID=53468 RepID=A0A0R3U8I8_MESCO|nr:unnamed protein product [Mesocestoides corti]
MTVNYVCFSNLQQSDHDATQSALMSPKCIVLFFASSQHSDQEASHQWSCCVAWSLGLCLVTWDPKTSVTFFDGFPTCLLPSRLCLLLLLIFDYQVQPFCKSLAFQQDVYGLCNFPLIPSTFERHNQVLVHLAVRVRIPSSLTVPVFASPQLPNPPSLSEFYDWSEGPSNDPISLFFGSNGGFGLCGPNSTEFFGLAPIAHVTTQSPSNYAPSPSH